MPAHVTAFGNAGDSIGRYLRAISVSELKSRRCPGASVTFSRVVIFVGFDASLLAVCDNIARDDALFG
jgi:hypothetical protein